MTALTADRQTTLSKPDVMTRGVAASVTCFAGAMISLDVAGYFRPTRANTTDRVVGINFGDKVVGTTAGAKKCTVRRDTAGWFANSASNDAIGVADIGRDCYAVDDQTVALTDGSGTRPRAGRIAEVDSATGVLVDFRYAEPKLISITVDMTDVSAADSEHIACPVAGKVVGIYAVIENAVTGADSAVTTAIQPAAGGGFTPITGGGFTVAVSGSGAGKSYTATPTGANTVAPGDTLRVTSDGASSTTSLMRVTFLIAAA